MKRVHYFKEQLLTAEVFQTEQDYNLNKRRLQNRQNLGVGVVSGLHVSTQTDGIHIFPGVAIDPLGREIIVTEPQIVPYPSGHDAVSLLISYTEKPTDPAPAAGEQTNGPEYTRVEEGIVLELTPSDTGNENAVVVARLRWINGEWKIVTRCWNPLFTIGCGLLFLAAVRCLRRAARNW